MAKNKNFMRKKEGKIDRIYHLTPHTQLKSYIKERKKTNKAGATLTQEASEIERYLNYLSPDHLPMDTDFLCNHVPPEKIFDYVNHKRKGTDDNTVSPKTAAVRLSILRKFYKFLLSSSKGPALRNPTLSVKVPKVVPKGTDVLSKSLVKHTLLSILTGDEVVGRQRESWEKTKYRDFAIITILLNTGLTRAEILDLNLEDLFLGVDTTCSLKELQELYDQSELSAEEYLKLLLLSKLPPEKDLYDYILDSLGFLFVFSDGKPRKIYLNRLSCAALYFYLLLERNALEISSGALFLSLKKRRMSQKTVENIVAKYFVPFTDIKVTPALLRKTYAAYILREDESALPILAHRMGYKDTSYLKSTLDRSSDDSESLGKEIGSIDFQF